MKGIQDAQSKAPIHRRERLPHHAIKAESLQIIADAPFGVEDFAFVQLHCYDSHDQSRFT